MCTLVVFIVGAISFFFNNNPLARLFFFFSLLAFSIAVDGNAFNIWDSMYVHAYAVNDAYVYMYWFTFVIGYLVFCLSNHSFKSVQALVKGPVCTLKPVNYSKLRMVARLISLLSVSLALIKLVDVGDLSLLFSDPRSWEKKFARNVFSNYFYFLHISGLILLACLISAKQARVFDYLLVVICLFISTFHGIKFTILHAFAYFGLALYVLNNYRLPKLLFLLGGVFTLLILSFFILIRGGGVEGLVYYILSASVNSIYYINISDVSAYTNFKAFFPLDGSALADIFDRLGGGMFQAHGVSTSSGFLLNDKYNLMSAITKVSFSGPFGFIFISFLLGLGIKSFPKRLSVFQVAFLAHLIFVILMMFTAWELYKYKLVFNLMVLYLVSRYVHEQRWFKNTVIL